MREEEDPDAVLLILDPPKGNPDFPPTVAEEELPPLQTPQVWSLAEFYSPTSL